MYDKLVAKVNNIDTSGFVLKTNYDTDKTDLEKQINDADKENPDTIAGFINNTELDRKVATLATKAESKAKQDKILKLQAFHSSYFRGKNHFADDGSHNYLIFQPMYRYWK